MIKINEIKNFEKKQDELKQKQYNSIYLELKRNFTLQKSIKIHIQDFREKFLMISKIQENPIEGSYVKINNKLSKIVAFKAKEISFIQNYKEFYTIVEIILKKNKMIFINRIFHLFALTNDSLKSIIIKKYLKKEFKSRFSKMKNLVKEL